MHCVSALSSIYVDLRELGAALWREEEGSLGASSGFAFTRVITRVMFVMAMDLSPYLDSQDSSTVK